MKSENVLLWFKNDLRIHDNEALTRAIATGRKVLPVYCFDSRLYQNLGSGFKKAGINRFIFLLQSVKALKDSLQNIGGDLLITHGIPEAEIAKLMRKYDCTELYAEQEYAFEELEVIKNLKLEIGDQCTLNFYWGKTLYHIDDIPYSISEIPLTSKAYRINTTKNTSVRTPLPSPKSLTVVSKFPESNIPTPNTFKLENVFDEKLYVEGGEKNALERLEYYTFKSECLTNYRWTRNRSQGLDYSSKFSPYLALGCISPRTIYKQVENYEKSVKKNQSTWWLIFELVWRDFFTFKGMRVGTRMFATQGYKEKEIEWENDKKLFDRWCNGMTGIPFVDAHMRQLNKTGFMSNRGRVNCSSFLIHDYKIDWTWGAAYFESKLIDYDVSSNWMNWHYQAFEIWYTNPVNQSLKYKAQDFIKEHIPELRNIQSNKILIPWEYGIAQYPKPAEIYKKWTRAINKIRESIPTQELFDEA